MISLGLGPDLPDAEDRLGHAADLRLAEPHLQELEPELVAPIAQHVERMRAGARLEAVGPQDPLAVAEDTAQRDPGPRGRLEHRLRRDLHARVRLDREVDLDRVGPTRLRRDLGSGYRQRLVDPFGDAASLVREDPEGLLELDDGPGELGELLEELRDVGDRGLPVRESEGCEAIPPVGGVMGRVDLRLLGPLRSVGRLDDLVELTREPVVAQHDRHRQLDSLLAAIDVHVERKLVGVHGSQRLLNALDQRGLTIQKKDPFVNGSSRPWYQASSSFSKSVS